MEHHKRVIAFKNKEQGLRTRALAVNAEHGLIAQKAYDQVQMKKSLDNEALKGDQMKFGYEKPNYNRSPHQYVSSWHNSLIFFF